MYFNPRIEMQVHLDPTKFDFRLLASNGDHIFANNGENTDVVYLIGKKVKIRAKDNDNVSYSLGFRRDTQANVFANCVIAADSAPYKVSEPL